MSKIWKDFWVTIKVYELFDDGCQEFRERPEICYKCVSLLCNFLWLRLMGEAWLLDWEDPEIRVEAFSLKFERDID